MNWDKPILTDSWLSNNVSIKIKQNRFKNRCNFKSHLDGKNNFESRKKYSSTKINKF